MADTQTQEDIEFRFGLVQDFGLIDGVAHGLIGALKNLFFSLIPIFSLEIRPALQSTETTSNPCDFKDPFDDLGLFDQTDTKGQSQTLIAHLLGKLADFYDAGLGGLQDIGPLVAVGITFPLLDGGLAGKFSDLRVFIFLYGLDSDVFSFSRVGQPLEPNPSEEKQIFFGVMISQEAQEGRGASFFILITDSFSILVT